MLEAKFGTIIRDNSGVTYSARVSDQTDTLIDQKDGDNAKGRGHTKKAKKNVRVSLGVVTGTLPPGATDVDLVADVVAKMKTKNDGENLKFKDKDIYAEL